MYIMESADDWRKKGNALMQKSNWEDAMVCYFRGIDHEDSDDENKAKCFCNLSLAQFKMGMYEEAVTLTFFEQN